jgi:hypothetical protein
MSPLTLTFVTALISSLASAIVASIVALLRNKASKTQKMADAEKKQMDALSQGMRALLWQKIKYYFEVSEIDSGLTLADREALNNIYSAYHAIGGNGTGTRLYKEAMEKPVITD